jgi:hypothetical protein
MRRLLIVISAALLLMLGVTATASAGPLGLWQTDFKRIASGGQGDWRNVYAWSMASFKGDLYVGTARQAAIAPVMEFMTQAMPGFQMPPELFPSDAAPFIQSFMTLTMPPKIFNDANFEKWNAASSAEIWRLHEGAWTRVYQAPRVPAGVVSMTDPTKMYTTPLAIGFRNMVPFTDRDGTSALYASAGSFSLAYQPKLLFWSSDGLAWNPVSAKPLMGIETRALCVHHGKLYVGAGTATSTALGMPSVPGAVWCSDKPSDPTSWVRVLDFPVTAPENTGVMSMVSANDRLYVGTECATGFQVWRSTVADPTSRPEDWKLLVKDGAGDEYNAWAGTMKAFRNDVYVGSMAVPGVTKPGSFAMKGFDVIRIRPNDTWQLLVGNRTPTIPVPGGPSTRTAITGLPSGFGMPTNLYCWNMEVYNGWLYVGSMDMSSMLRAASDAGVEMPDMGMGIPDSFMKLFLKAAGFDLWKTPNGLAWLPVTITGLGDYKNYGARTIRVHDNKLYIGTANPFEGFQVWKSR